MWPHLAYWLSLCGVAWSQENRCHVRSKKNLLSGGCRHNSSGLIIKNEPRFGAYFLCQLLEGIYLKLYQRSVGRGEATGSKLHLQTCQPNLGKRPNSIILCFLQTIIIHPNYFVLQSCSFPLCLCLTCFF